MEKLFTFKSLVILAFSIFLITCKKETGPDDVNPDLPAIGIDSITDISLTGATISANITSGGKSAVTERGICWGTNPNPTTANTKKSAGSGNGWFSAKMNGLVKGTTYYVRAYATNTEGTSYSGQQVIKPGTVTDIDGNVYDLVTIGARTWIAANLRVTKFNNGEPIPLVTDNTAWKNLSTGAYCYVNNSAGTKTDYGLLYNWFAASDVRGICPKGYKAIVDNAYYGLAGGASGGSGGKLKETGTKYWKTPNTGATNSTGFSARGTGFRDADGVYTMFNEKTYFWDVDGLGGGDKAYVAWMNYNDADFTTNFWTLDKNHGLCIRCLLK